MFTGKKKQQSGGKSNKKNNSKKNVVAEKTSTAPQITEKRLKKLESIEMSLTDFLFGNQQVVEPNKELILDSATALQQKKRPRSTSNFSDSDSDSDNDDEGDGKSKTKDEDEENVEQLDDQDLFMIDKPTATTVQQPSTTTTKTTTTTIQQTKVFLPLKPAWTDPFTEQIYIQVDSDGGGASAGDDDDDVEEDLKENAKSSLMDHSKSIMQAFLSKSQRKFYEQQRQQTKTEENGGNGDNVDNVGDEDDDDDASLITGAQYEARMRQLYQKIHQTPKWAQLATEKVTLEETEERIVVQERFKSLSSSTSATSAFSNYSTDRAFDTSVRHITKGQLDFGMCLDANEQERPSDVLSVRFHPHSDLLAALGSDRTVRLFQVPSNNGNNGSSSTAGDRSVLVDRFVASDDSDRIVNNKRRKKKRRDVSSGHSFMNGGGASVNSMEFTADGLELIMTAPNTRAFFVCDMTTGESRIVSNLVHRIAGVNQGAKRGRTIQVDDSLLPMIRCSSNNELIAIGCANNSVELLSRESKFSVGQLVMNDPVRAIEFSQDSLTLYAATKSGKVYLWDLRQQRPRHVFQDEGSIDTTSISIFDSVAKSRIACGSNSGVVNLYDLDHVQSARDPKPLKSLMNLTTSVSRTQFSKDGKLLCIASKDKVNAVKMVHVESMSVYPHFPYQPSANTAHQMTVTDFHFNSNSQYLALSTGPRVRLFQFPYYAQSSTGLQ